MIDNEFVITRIEELSAIKCAEGTLRRFRMTNAEGAYVELCNVGAGITSVVVPDREGAMADVLLGYDDPRDYVGDGPCMGKIPGRYANRIAAGRFTLDDSPMGKGAYKYHDYAGVAIECQNFPDAPNHPSFPTSVLRRGERYDRTISFAFSVR